MEKIGKYIKILWIIVGASLLLGIIGEVLQQNIFIGNEVATAISVKIIEILIVSIFNILLIKNIAESEDKKFKMSTYIKVVVVMIILNVITTSLADGLFKLKEQVGDLAIWGISAVAIYIIKILLSFTVYIIVLEDAGVIASIGHSIRITLKKENILKILLWNLIFLVILLLENATIKTQDTLLATTFMEIVTYFTFTANEMLYLDCEK